LVTSSRKDKRGEGEEHKFRLRRERIGRRERKVYKLRPTMVAPETIL